MSNSTCNIIMFLLKTWGSKYILGKTSVLNNKTLENTKGQSKHDNLEKLTT